MKGSRSSSGKNRPPRNRPPGCARSLDGGRRRGSACRRRVGASCGGSPGRRDWRCDRCGPAPRPSRGDPRSRVGGDRPASGCRAPVCVYGQGEARNASRTSRRIRLVERQKQEWSVAHIEIRRPPIKWKPGGKPIPFTVRTAGIKAQHVTGTGAERLMFAFSRDGEPLKVYGRKFPVFDSCAAQEEAVAGRREDREADHLSAIHRGHLRSAFRQRRQGIPANHRAQGDRGIAPRKSAFCGISGRASRRRRASRSHLHPCGDRTDG